MTSPFIKYQVTSGGPCGRIWLKKLGLMIWVRGGSSVKGLWIIFNCTQLSPDLRNDPSHNHLGPKYSFTACGQTLPEALLDIMNLLSSGLKNVNTQSYGNWILGLSNLFCFCFFLPLKHSFVSNLGTSTLSLLFKGLWCFQLLQIRDKRRTVWKMSDI